MKAKDLFEELGFKLDRNYKDTIVWCKTDFPQCDIYFYDKDNIEIDTKYGVSVKLLEAINKQIEELGWLDD